MSLRHPGADAEPRHVIAKGRRMKDLSTLRDTVQRLRERNFPQLPKDLVDAILDIEAANIDDRGRSRELVTRAITEQLQHRSGA